MIDLENDILEPVATRISERASSLSEIHRFNRCGIEGWLKVEAVCALSNIVKSVNNAGPDLTLADGTQVELKGATDFNRMLMRRACLKYSSPCLFLADGSQLDRISEIENGKVEMISHRIISDGTNDWIVGLAAPNSYLK